MFPVTEGPLTECQLYFHFSIIEECLKIYHGNKDRAYERAVTEEKMCYARSKTRLETFTLKEGQG